MADWDTGQGIQGGVGGAMTGAGVGSMIMPGVGTAIGAGVGFLGGLFGGGFGGGSEQDEYQKLLKDLASGYGGRQAPQMGPAAQAAQSQLMQNRQQFIAQLEAQAAGTGPSAARQLMQQATDKGQRNATAMAAGAGGRGVNAGAAMRNAMGTGAAMQMQNSQNMGVLRSQEQLNAMGQLGQNLQAGIGQDQQLNMFNTGQMNDQSQMNAQLQMQMLGLNTQAQLQALGMAGGMASPGLGTSIMAGGAQAFPGLMQLAGQMNKPQQGYGGAIGPQPGQPGYAQSPMGQRQQNLQNAYIQQNTPQAPQAPAPLPAGFMGTPWGGPQQ